MAYLTWEEYQQQYPAPYDLETYTQQGNEQFANMLWDQRPQEWLDEYDRMRKANLEWQANYYNGGFSQESPSNFALLNPYFNGGWYYGSNGSSEWIPDPTPEPQVDWYAEAAAGRPVIGGSVTPNMTAQQYYGNNPIPAGVPQQLNQSAYPPGGGLPTPTPQPQQQLSSGNQAALDVGQGLQTLGNAITRAPQYSGGGTISNFWDQNSGSQNTGSVPSPMSNMGLGNSFQDWFTKTYGSKYGLS